MNQEKLVKLIHSKGHTIGSHTYDHKNLNNLEDDISLYIECDAENYHDANIVGMSISDSKNNYFVNIFAISEFEYEFNSSLKGWIPTRTIKSTESLILSDFVLFCI